VLCLLGERHRIVVALKENNTYSQIRAFNLARPKEKHTFKQM